MCNTSRAEPTTVRLLAGLLAAAILAPHSPAQTFTNGSFESPVITAGGTQSRTHGSVLGSWTANFNPAIQSIVLNNGDGPGGAGNGFAPHTGDQYYTFNAGNDSVGGNIGQDITTVIGQQYRVGFSVARFGPGAGTPRIQGAAFNDPSGSNTLITSLEGAGPATVGQYQSYTFDFTAISTTTRLRFADTSTATLSLDVGLDSITLTPVPEPAAVGLLAVAGLVGYRRLRRRL